MSEKLVLPVFGVMIEVVVLLVVVFEVIVLEVVVLELATSIFISSN